MKAKKHQKSHFHNGHGVYNKIKTNEQNLIYLIQVYILLVENYVHVTELIILDTYIN